MVVTSSIVGRVSGNCFLQVTNEETGILVGRDQEILSYKPHPDGFMALHLPIIPMSKIFRIFPKDPLVQQIPSGNNS